MGVEEEGRASSVVDNGEVNNPAAKGSSKAGASSTAAPETDRLGKEGFNAADQGKEQGVLNGGPANVTIDGIASAEAELSRKDADSIVDGTGKGAVDREDGGDNESSKAAGGIKRGIEDVITDTVASNGNAVDYPPDPKRRKEDDSSTSRKGEEDNKSQSSSSTTDSQDNSGDINGDNSTVKQEPFEFLNKFTKRKEKPRRNSAAGSSVGSTTPTNSNGTAKRGRPSANQRRRSFSPLDVLDFARDVALNPFKKISEGSSLRAEFLALRDLMYVGPSSASLSRNKKDKTGDIDNIQIPDRERRDRSAKDVGGGGSSSSSKGSSKANDDSERERALNSLNGAEEYRRLGRTANKKFSRPCSPSNFCYADEKIVMKRTREILDNPQAKLNTSLHLLRAQENFSSPPDINDPGNLLIKSSRQLLSNNPKKKKNAGKAQLAGIHHHNTLGTLTSPLYNPTIQEQWSPHEIAVFESGMCAYGKRFHSIQKLIKNKTTQQVVDFFYIWKKTDKYKTWKRTYNN